jgi:hypothetical protein
MPPDTAILGETENELSDAELLEPTEEEQQVSDKTPDSVEDEEVVEDKKESDKEDQESEEDSETVKLANDRPTIKAIKAEFPDFFNKFPELKDAYFREIEFTKLFPTVEDAKEAFEDNEAFNNLSESALSGNPVPLLESIEKTDPKAFELFTVSFLPSLYKKNQEAYNAAVTPIFEGLVRQMYRNSDENLRNTAENVAQFLFGDDGKSILDGKVTFSKTAKLSEEQQKLNSERESRNATAFRESVTYVESEIDKNLKAIILRDFDPNKVFSKFMRDQLATEVVKRIKNQLGQDTAHRSVMSSRWKRAKNNGYSAAEKDKIISTFLARAKSLIPINSEKVRSLAAGKQIKAADDKRQRLAPVKRELNGGRPTSGNGRESRSLEKKDLRKMSDMEILNMD